MEKLENDTLFQRATVRATGNCFFFPLLEIPFVGGIYCFCVRSIGFAHLTQQRLIIGREQPIGPSNLLVEEFPHRRQQSDGQLRGRRKPVDELIPGRRLNP